MSAVLLPFLLLFAEDIIVVTQVPMFCPTVIKQAAPFETDPASASVWSMDTDAVELDNITVTTAPARTASTGVLPSISNESIKMKEIQKENL